MALAEALIAGGCGVIQLRCKGWDDDAVRRVGLEVRARTRAAGVAFVVNDSPSLAVELDADGLHLGQLDGPMAEARAVVGARWIGRSTHTPDQVRAALAEGADYVAFGPVFDTPNLSRPKAVRGVERLAAVRPLIPADVPLVAIGGITEARLPAVREAGATSWAIIGAIAHATDPVATVRRLL